MKEKKEVKKEKETKEQPTTVARREAQPPTSFTPFGFMRRFANDMERLFEDFEGFSFPSIFRKESLPFGKDFEQVAWVPQIEVMQKDDQFIVRADLPGLKKSDVKVDVTDNLLTISGERKEEKEEKREGFYRSERSYGSFYRRIPLPEGAKTDTATAEFTDGVLEINMKAPEREPRTRRLEITEAETRGKAKAAGA